MPEPMKAPLFSRLSHVLPHREPWHSPAYLAGVFTWRVACEIAGDFRNAIRGEEIARPPHCLRLRPAYRTPEIIAFRARVAGEARRRYRNALPVS